MNIALIGGGTQLPYSIDIIEKQNVHNIVGIIDSKQSVNTSLFNYKIIGRQENIIDLIKEYNIEGCVITIGDNWSRKMVHEEVSRLVPNMNWPNAIHPSVIIGKDVVMGQGILAMAGVIVNTGAYLGNFTNYFTRCNIEHDCYICDYSSVSAGVVLGGKVKIGMLSAIALNATIFDRVTIGENSIIGAASLITKDVPDNVLIYGNPGRIIRSRNLDEKFLK
ncbi:MAG: sugar O-acyltransferase (sialic acid O-acetyltransferase NeuD family) [Clostridium sp.]|jgi:sugar O-acyltransferase (sialic acid O-acetyltransferase NeuD family)